MNKTFLKGLITKATGDEDVYEFIASTSSVDRQGDSIDQNGWELDNFKANPVILFAHDYGALPIGKCIEIIKNEAKLIIKMVFASEEANPKAQQIKRLVDEGILNTTSVGFIQKERNGNIITRQELLEVSIVPVPANQDALRLAFKSMDDSLVKEIEDAIAVEIEAEHNEEEEKPIVPPVEEVTEKSGKVISKATRKKLESTMTALKNAVSEIEGLLVLDATTTEDNADGKSQYVVLPKSLVEDLQFILRGETKSNEKLLSELKKNL